MVLSTETETRIKRIEKEYVTTFGIALYDVLTWGEFMFIKYTDFKEKFMFFQFFFSFLPVYKLLLNLDY